MYIIDFNGYRDHNQNKIKNEKTIKKKSIIIYEGFGKKF